MLEEIKRSADYIQQRISELPKIGVVLGSGLGGFAGRIDVIESIPYSEIPGFSETTVEGHAGNLIYGTYEGVSLLAMQGRFHFYEGIGMQRVVFPIRVMKLLGIEKLILSNASGGVNPDFEIGDVMIQTDHINLMGDNPLIGQNLDELGPRFPDMSEAYSKEMIQKALDFAHAKGMEVRTGVYAAVTGPCLETPAEYFYIRTIGADTVGMSTVPEVIAARHMGMECFAFSIITDLGVPGKIVKVTHEDVQAAAAKSEPVMSAIAGHLILNS
jgi:purine-nucleoside phosphorylase